MKPTPEGLLCALVLAPTTYSRNKFFTLFEHPRRARARARARQLRTLVAHLASRSDRPVDVRVDELPGGAVTLAYRLPSVGLTRTARLEALEASVVRWALHRASAPGFEQLAPGDRARVEAALAGLGLERPSLDDPIAS